MNATITHDFRRFRGALAAVRRYSRRDDAHIVNKALKDVAFRAAQHTPKSTAVKIRGGLSKELLAKLAAAHLKRTQGTFTRAQHADTMKRIRAARVSRIGALRAGWIPAIQDMGGTYRGAKSKPTGSASAGFGRKATEAHLGGLIRNTIKTRSARGSRSAEHITQAVAGLAAGVRFVTVDRERYARELKERTLRRYSDT